MKIPVVELKLRISSTEFLKWIEVLNEEEVRPPTRLEQYLAQLTAEVRLMRLAGAKKKVRVRLSDFFLHFRFKSTTDATVTPLTPEEVLEKKKAVSKASKRRWFGILGIKE